MYKFKEKQQVSNKFYITDKATRTTWFPFLILDLKASKQEHSFIFPGIKAQTFGAKKEIVSVPYFTVLGTLLKNSLFVLRLCGKVLLILKTSPIIVDESL